MIERGWRCETIYVCVIDSYFSIRVCQALLILPILLQLSNMHIQNQFFSCTISFCVSLFFSDFKSLVYVFFSDHFSFPLDLPFPIWCHGFSVNTSLASSPSLSSLYNLSPPFTPLQRRTTQPPYCRILSFLLPLLPTATHVIKSCPPLSAPHRLPVYRHRTTFVITKRENLLPKMPLDATLVSADSGKWGIQ